MNIFRLHIAHKLTYAIIVLAAIASAVGLLLPSVYRETDWVVPQNRGQDLVTLIALAVLMPITVASRNGSARATLIWIGLLGYIWYTYTGASFSYGFNQLFLIYVALFSLSSAALIAGLSSIDVMAIQRAFDASTPRRAVIVFLLLMAAMLSLLWLSQIIPFFTRGQLPEMILRAKTPTVFVYVLDLGFVVPLALLSACWLKCDYAWGYALASIVLVKSATMGIALVSMTWFAWRAGLPLHVEMTAAWILLAAAGTAMSIWLFRHCHGSIAKK
jgi:hypothetical protein